MDSGTFEAEALSSHMSYGIRFYADIVHHDTMTPARLHNRRYPTIKEAEKVARSLMPVIRTQFGSASGYLVVGADGRAVAMGQGAV